MRRLRLVYLEPVPIEVEALVRSRIPASIELIVRRADQSAEEAVADADFVLVGTTPVTLAVIESARRVRLIQQQGVGYDNTDIAAASARGIPVATCPNGTTTSVAEHVVMLVLAVLRHLVVADASLRRGEWLTWELRPSSRDLGGKMVGLLGFGRIGRRVARLVRAFDANVIYHDVAPADLETERGLDATYVSMDELLSRSDVLSVHVPLTPATRHIVGVREIARMKPSAILINAARGGLVDEHALATALEEERLAGAGVDVYEMEPIPPDSPLLRAPNVVLTPHIAAGTRDALSAKIDFCVLNVRRVVDGLEPLNVVRPLVDAHGGNG